MRVLRSVALALLLLPLSGMAASKPENWVELRSEHFHVVSNAKPKDIQRAMRKLEEFRHLLSYALPGLRVDSPLPTSVILFKDEKSYRNYVPLTTEGKPMKADGFMQPGRERMYLVIDLSAAEPEETSFHEFIHLVNRLNFDNMPVWLDEGLAEFYERTDVDGRDFVLGDFQPGWWDLLQRSQLIPLEVLTEVDYRSPYYNNEDKRAVFYAQAWLLMHYWMAADEGKRRPQFARFLTLFRQGASQADALKQAFGTDFAGMNKQLDDYLGRRMLSNYVGKLDQATTATFTEPAPLSPAVALAWLSDLWLNRGDVERAEQALRAVAAEGAGEPEVLLRLGRIALLRNHADEAELHFRGALAARPDDLRLRFYTAVAVQMNSLRRMGDPAAAREAANEIVELLTPVASQADFPEASRMLVQARLTRNDPPEELIPAIEQARARNPQSREFDLLLAHLYERAERWNDAEALLQQVIARATTPEQRRQAEDQLDSLKTRRVLSRAPRSQPVPRASEPVEPTVVEQEEEPERVEPRVEREREVYNPEPAPPSAPPEVKYVKGTLVDVACADDAAVLTVKLEGKPGAATRVIRLKVRSRANLLLLDPTGSGKTIECGAADIPVGINYQVEPQTAGVVGVVMTVELYPPPR
ncbi:MAG TPA: tetratricopeptide repeat protein [Candidatus Xenobia bacterium]|nr:tetratricopeptide repeat protein [Candidatus Xenobia bacterium]